MSKATLTRILPIIGNIGNGRSAFYEQHDRRRFHGREPTGIDVVAAALVAFYNAPSDISHHT